VSHNMDFKFYCPHCGRHLQASTANVGGNAGCPGCHQMITIPTPASPPALSAPLFPAARPTGTAVKPPALSKTAHQPMQRKYFPAWERWLLAYRFKRGEPEFGGLTRGAFFLVMAPVSYVLGDSLRHESKDPLLTMVVMFAVFCTLPAMLRFRNIGLTMWWSLLAVIPVLNIPVFIFLYALPEGFVLKRKADIPMVLLITLGAIFSAIGFVNGLQPSARPNATEFAPQTPALLPAPSEAARPHLELGDPTATASRFEPNSGAGYPLPATPFPEPATNSKSGGFLNILTYAPLHTVPGETGLERKRRETADQEAAMRKIESFGYYAVSKATLDKSVRLGDRSGRWNLKGGEAFPFLGFAEGSAFLRIGTTWMLAPRSAIDVVPLADHPDLVARYGGILDKREQFIAQAVLNRQEAVKVVLRHCVSLQNGDIDALMQTMHPDIPDTDAFRASRLAFINKNLRGAGRFSASGISAVTAEPDEIVVKSIERYDGADGSVFVMEKFYTLREYGGVWRVFDIKDGKKL